MEKKEEERIRREMKKEHDELIAHNQSNSHSHNDFGILSSGSMKPSANDNQKPPVYPLQPPMFPTSHEIN